MKIIKNIGDDDRKYRAIIGIAAAWWGVASGNPQTGFFIAAAVMLTAYYRWCPLYQLLDLNTQKKK